MLPLYRAMIFFPGGNPAAGASINVSSDGSNVAPLLYLDSAGTLVSPNPIIADGMGTITFYASPGFYLAWISGAAYRIRVDPAWPDPVYADVFIHEQTVASATWTVDHHFGTDPSVTIITGGTQVESQITHPSVTQTVITLSAPLTGTAYLRR